MTEDQLVAPKWLADWDERTAELAYDVAKETRDRLSAWGESIDRKLFAAFGLGGIILTVAPALQPPSHAGGAMACWVIALVFWLVALGAAVYGYQPKVFKVGPDPYELLSEEWLSKSPLHFQLWQLSALGKSFRRNHAVLQRKAGALSTALGFVAAEILAIALALLLSGGRS